MQVTNPLRLHGTRLPSSPTFLCRLGNEGEGGGHCPLTSSFTPMGLQGAPLFPHKGAVISGLFAASGASGRGCLLALPPSA